MSFVPILFLASSLFPFWNSEVSQFAAMHFDFYRMKNTTPAFAI